jgi:hypothetical protein
MSLISDTILHGGRASFSIKPAGSSEVLMAVATGVTVSENINYEEIQVLNHLKVAEHEATNYRCSLSCEQFRLIEKTLKSVGIQPRYSQILSTAEMTAKITGTGKDGTAKTITVLGVKFAGQDINIRAGAVQPSSVKFVATEVIEDDE